VTLHERLLLPNHGRDPAAFLDHVVEFYDDLPEVILFMHGHGAIPVGDDSWSKHTNCETIFSRSIFYYRDLVRERVGEEKRVQDHLMTLTSFSKRDSGLVFNLASNPQHEVSRFRANRKEEQMGCHRFFGKWKHVIRENSPYFTNDGNPNPRFSCCLTFVLPAKRILRYPREFYQDWKSVLTNVHLSDFRVGRTCFEFMFHDLFGDEKGTFSDGEVLDFYEQARTLVRNDPSVSQRAQHCKDTADSLYNPPPSDGPL